jgi:two-component system response regulator (stage 0 sporulation protein F)
MSIREFLHDRDTVLRLNAAIRCALAARRQGGVKVGRILLVDDDPLVRTVLERALARAGHAVVTAENGRVALDRFDDGPAFDLVITDIQMPEIDGLELILELKRRPAPPRILAMTSRSGPEGYLNAAKRFGAERAMLKPADMQRLVTAAGELLEA